jgi:hypothetical protein
MTIISFFWCNNEIYRFSGESKENAMNPINKRVHSFGFFYIQGKKKPHFLN